MLTPDTGINRHFNINIDSALGVCSSPLAGGGGILWPRPHSLFCIGRRRIYFHSLFSDETEWGTPLCWCTDCFGCFGDNVVESNTTTANLSINRTCWVDGVSWLSEFNDRVVYCERWLMQTKTAHVTLGVQRSQRSLSLSLTHTHTPHVRCVPTDFTRGICLKHKYHWMQLLGCVFSYVKVDSRQCCRWNCLFLITIVHWVAVILA